jgi:hypothetical protein
MPIDVQETILSLTSQGRINEQRLLAQYSTLNKSLRQTLSRVVGTPGERLPSNPVEILKKRLEKYDSDVVSLDLTDANLAAEPLLSLIQAAGRSPSCTDFLLAGNRIDDTLCRAIQALLGHTCVIKKLDLRNNDWTSRGLGVISHMVEQHQELTHLDLGLNHISAEGFTSLITTLERAPNVRYLGLMHCGIPRDFPAIAAFKATRPDCQVEL